MPVSGRRYKALQQQTADQRIDILRLERELTDAVAERDAARDALAALRTRHTDLVGRPLTAGEAVLARLLRASEEGRRALADRLDDLQQANVSLTRELHDARKGGNS
ncbi:hypothetical protein [Streptomyces sp. NPDC101206]|uniref:hypothetical protein n=1 Tax=Streptomyces sp. NPDC101206 TaxID=3366128 RepID=UPI0037F8FE5F